MSADTSLPPETPPRAARTRTFGLAAAVVAVILAVAVLARKPVAEYVITNGLRQAGLSGVSLTVTRLDAAGLAVEDFTAEGGALAISRIEARFTLPGLLRSRIDSLDVGKLAAALSWTEDGLRLGGYHVRRQSDQPLSLPEIGRLSLPDGALTVATPDIRLQAPFSVTAEPVESGWNTAIKAAISGPGVELAMEWTGVVATAELAQSNGHGTFQLDIDSLAVPGMAGRLDAEGSVMLAAADGTFAVTVNKPLAFSFDAPPLGVQGLDTLPWSVTIAPSTSNAALVLTHTRDQSSVRFDITATAEAGGGDLQFALAGSGSRAAQEAPRFQLSTARGEIRNFPAGGGTVSGRFNVSDLAGSLQDAQGRIEAVLDAADMTAGGLTLGQAQAGFAGAIRVTNGAAALTFKDLRATLSRAAFADWALAAPATLDLANSGSAQVVSYGSPSGVAADVGLTLSALTLRNSEDATLTAQFPDIKLGAKERSVTLIASRIALTHPIADVRDGRVDATFDGNGLSGKTTAQLVRLGPAPETGGMATGALTATATLTTRANDLDIRGAFTAASGAKLGDFSARIGAASGRGTAALSIPKKRFERGGTNDASDLGFITAVSDLTGTFGLEAKATWNAKTHTETALVTLDDVAFGIGDAGVSGLTTTIELTSLFPPRSAKPHHVTARSITAGLPLTGFAADFALAGDGTAAVTQGAVEIAGGKISMTDAIVPIDGRDGAFALGVEKLDMAQLSALAKVDGLSVTGTLSGAVPLRSGSTGIYFADGLLRADAPGRLVYTPASPPDALSQNQGGALLLQALSNFAYDRLSVTLNGPVTEDISLGVSLAGRNPDLYGGYPIEFNLNLSGRLTQILRQGLVGYGIPADIERQLREGQKRPGP